MELVSQHNHTGLTGHGEGTIEQLITQASKLGMTNVAITEHYPLSLSRAFRGSVRAASKMIEFYLLSLSVGDHSFN